MFTNVSFGNCTTFVCFLPDFSFLYTFYLDFRYNQFYYPGKRSFLGLRQYLPQIAMQRLLMTNLYKPEG